jgi:hypothetical protein
MPLSWEPLAYDTAGRPFGAVFDRPAAEFIGDAALTAEMLDVVYAAGGVCVLLNQAGISGADEEAFYDLFPGTDRSENMSFPPNSPLALPDQEMVHVMVTDTISLDNHPGAPGLSDEQARSDGYVKNGDTKGATGSSSKPDANGKLHNAIQFHHDGNFWRSLPPAWTMLSCHERSGCSLMSQQTTTGEALEFVGGDTLFASTDISRIGDKLSAAELESVLGASVVYQPRQVFGKQWSTEGHAIEMMDNGIRPVFPPSWDSRAPDLAELSEGRGLPPTHPPESGARHSEDGGQVFPLVRRHPVTGRETVFVHTLCMEAIELADGTRLGWEDSQEFVTRVLALLTTPSAVARVP